MERVKDVKKFILIHIKKLCPHRLVVRHLIVDQDTGVRSSLGAPKESQMKVIGNIIAYTLLAIFLLIMVWGFNNLSITEQDTMMYWLLIQNS